MFFSNGLSVTNVVTYRHRYAFYYYLFIVYLLRHRISNLNDRERELNSVQYHMIRNNN